MASSGRDFDPRTRAFSDEDLKPQPMIKKSRKQFVPDSLKDDKYWARRRKNNMAAKRSRDARRMKENQIALRAGYLEKEVLCHLYICTSIYVCIILYMFISCSTVIITYVLLFSDFIERWFTSRTRTIEERKPTATGQTVKVWRCITKCISLVLMISIL